MGRRLAMGGAAGVAALIIMMISMAAQPATAQLFTPPYIFARSMDAAKMAEALVNPASFDVVKTTDKLPKFTGSAVSAGFIAWFRSWTISAPGVVDPPDGHALIAEMGRGGALVMSTGDAAHTTRTAYSSVDSDLPPTTADITNPSIPSSHDVAVLDFWVRPRVTGNVEFGFFLATNELDTAIPRKHAAGVVADDTVMVEVNGKQVVCSYDNVDPGRLTILEASRSSQMRWGKNMEYSAYIRCDIHMQTQIPTVAGQDMRWKIRLADVGDRIIDTALYVPTGSLRIRG